jgi:hypothetical protein
MLRGAELGLGLFATRRSENPAFRQIVTPSFFGRYCRAGAMVQGLQCVSASLKVSRRSLSLSINRSIDDWQAALTYTQPQRPPFLVKQQTA